VLAFMTAKRTGRVGEQGALHSVDVEAPDHSTAKPPVARHGPSSRITLAIDPRARHTVVGVIATNR
jgi:hypothetical protein